MKHYETLRESYRPETAGNTTLVLMIGESRPANGTFFYSADSNLFRYTNQAFAKVHSSVDSGTAFLKWFQSNGFYLIDLCDRPVNQLETRIRRAARRTSEAHLASVLANASAGVQVLVLMKAIRPNVERALTASGRHDMGIDALLDFPAQGNQRRYVAGLASFLQQKGPLRTQRPIRRATRLPSIRDGQLTLHEEIRQILLSYRNKWLTTREIADKVNHRGNYHKRDGSDVTPYQIHGRTRKYPQLFERDGSRVRLLDN